MNIPAFCRPLLATILMLTSVNAQAQTCCGDCDGDGKIVVGELVMAVRANLNGEEPTRCADCNLDGSVAVNELVKAIGFALRGCDSPNSFDDAFLGDPAAPVTIMMYFDFQDPFTQIFVDETLPELRRVYIDSNKVQLIFRDFPLSFHPSAHKAAQAAECAGEQGEYVAMFDRLFVAGARGLGEDRLKGYALEIGLDTTQFNACLDSEAQAAEVDADIDDGRNAGVTAPRTFFVNGVRRPASIFSHFEAIIERELARIQPRL